MDDDSAPLPLPPLAGREGGASRQRDPWWARAYSNGVRTLPAFVLAIMAGLTWWLAREQPAPSTTTPVSSTDNLPDYQMEGFSVRRLGQVNAQVRGERVQHFPRTDELKIDGARVAISQAGAGELDAVAPHAVVSASGSLVTLSGGATVERQGTAGELPLRFESNRMVIDTQAQTVQSDEPVVLSQGRDEVRAGSLRYDHLQRNVELRGMVRGRISRSAVP